MPPRYDLRPAIDASGGGGRVLQGYEAIARDLFAEPGAVVTVDCYPGVDVEEIAAGLGARVDGLRVFRIDGAMIAADRLDAMLARFLTDDRVFGVLAPFRMEEFFDLGRLAEIRDAAAVAAAEGPVLLIGVGAALARSAGPLVIADMPRWELQLRLRRGAPNWTADNGSEDILRKYKRGFFVEWRVADRHKAAIHAEASHHLDSTRPGDPKLVDGPSMRAALAGLLRRPFRVVPFFDPGVWGGQWMKEHFSLPEGPENYAWGFDCVPEENSLLFRFDGIEFEIPAINLVILHAEDLLGPTVYSRFGTEFPIRFDFLDTIEGGNLSLQVHPKTEYIQATFGMHYTQDESYYMLEAGPNAAVYIGFREGADVDAFLEDVERAQAGGPPPEVERYVNRIPVVRHDHISIPAGTIHCSGNDCVVLEISATPYIFTFKLWDWGRVGLDGLPRPVHLDHGRRNLVAERDTRWVEETILSAVEDVASGPGWREERTGLHPLEFIETRRHWFEAPVNHHTGGSVHVMNLIAGERAVVESPTGAFEPFEIGFAETFIIPASVGAYRVRPAKPGETHATIRASVRI